MPAQPTSLLRTKIYNIVAKIPRGKVASYGLVALLAGRPRAARAVGTAMREVPENHHLPCHRVLHSDGSLPPKRLFSGRQRAMLEKEKVQFHENGRVNMKSCEWNGDLTPATSPQTA